MKNLQRRFPLIRRYVLGVLLPVPLFFALGAQPQAAVVYSYTGNIFTMFNDSTFPTGAYDDTMRVTGSFTVAAPLSLPSMPDISASVLSYSFSDGRQTLADGDSQINQFRFGVNAAGTPTNWSLWVDAPMPIPTGNGDSYRFIVLQSDFFNPTASAAIQECISAPMGNCMTTSWDGAWNEFNAGTWTVTPLAAVPLPPAVLLLGSALVTLFGFGRFGMRRRRHV